MKTRTRLRAMITSILVLGVVGAVVAIPAQAAPPPAGYPTQQIMTTANNAVLGGIPIRRGFWDSDAGQGFGMDKAWHYHNLPSLKAQRNVLLSSNRTLQANGNWLLRAYAQKIVCPSGGSCYVDDEREVWGIYNNKTYTTYFGWPVGGTLGLQTMYCQQGGVIKCPSWVVLGLNNISNAPLSRQAEAQAVPEASPTPSIEAGLTAEERQAQVDFYASAEVQELLGQVESGEVILTASYEPTQK